MEPSGGVRHGRAGYRPNERERVSQTPYKQPRLAEAFHRNALQQQRLAFREDFRNFLDGVPITVRGRNTKELFHFAEIRDCSHLSSIKAQNESVLNRDDLEQPVVIRWETKGKRREFRCLMFEV